MNPTTNEVSGLNLPPPVLPELAPAESQTSNYQAVEQAPNGTAGVPASNPLMPAIQLPVPTAPLPNVITTNVSNTTSNANPSVADDADLIEKEWVHKAKEIIKQTQTDPHVQSRELNIFKADYMQKRYNKVLKLSE